MGVRRGLALLAVIALFLSACSSGSKEDAGQGETATDQTTDQTTADSTESPTTESGDASSTEASTDGESTDGTMADKECQTDGLTTLKVATVGIYTDATLDLATKNCSLADAGVAVEKIVVANPPAAIAALTGGEVDIAYAPSIPVVRAFDAGAPVRALAPADGYTQEGIDKYGNKLDDTAVYVAEAIASPADLSGKTVSVPARGAQLEVTTAYAVKEAGGDPSAVNFVALDLPNMIDAVKAGEIDAAGLVSPFTIEAQEQGLVDSGITAVDFFGPGAVGIWTTTQSALDDKGDALRGFRTAMETTNAEATANPQEFWELAAESTGVPLSSYQQNGVDYVFPTTLEPADFENVSQKLFDLGFLDDKPDVSTLIAQ